MDQHVRSLSLETTQRLVNMDAGIGKRSAFARLALIRRNPYLRLDEDAIAKARSNSANGNSQPVAHHRQHLGKSGGGLVAGVTFALTRGRLPSIVV
jgi:hypothetical protein